MAAPSDPAQPAEFLVHRALDGASYAFPPRTSFTSLETLVRALGELTGVDPLDVIPFFGNGEQAREENVLLAGTEGWDELYVFSKDTLQADAGEVIAALSNSLPAPTPPPDTLRDSTVSRAAVLTQLLDTSIYPLIDSLHTQVRALDLAASNLSLHLGSLAAFFSTLRPVATREFGRQRELLASYRTALWVVERIAVDRRLFSGKAGSAKDGGTTSAAERKLGDYVNLKKMAVVEEGCVKLEEELLEKWAKAESSIEELLAGEKQIRAVCESQRCDEADDCVAVAERAVERAKELEAQFRADESGSGTADEGQRELSDLERLVREKLELLIEIKSNFNSHLVHTLQSISHFQSFIPPMASTLNSLSATLRSPPGFSHLSRLYSLPLAYGRLLVESHRRLAFGAVFLEQSGRVAEVMARWVTSERRRREKYESEMKGLLPWDARTSDEVPGLEVSTVGEGLADDGTAVSRLDVDEFLAFIDELEHDPGYIDLALSTGLEKPSLLVELRETLVKHLAQVDDAKAEFDKLVEKTLLSKPPSGSSRRGSTVDETLVKALSTEKNELSGAVAAKDQTIQDLQSRLASIQTELKDTTDASAAQEAELVALRAELATSRRTADGLRSDQANQDAHVSKLSSERALHLRELAQARVQAQDTDDALVRARAAARKAEERVGELEKEMERKLKEKSLESERALRDHISEADGDRAILEHQLSQATAEVERQRTQAESELKLLQDKATRDLDAIKADLKMQKVQAKSVEARNKDLAGQLERFMVNTSSKDKENERLLVDALRLARTHKDSAEKLLDAIRSSSLASSLSLQSLTTQATNEQSTASSTSSLELPLSAPAQTIRKELDAIGRFDIRSFEEVILKSFKLVKKWQQKATEYRDKAKDKIAIGHFSPNDLALFLPTRNYTAAVRPWAAFNVNFPHYFLKTSTTLSEYLLTREYHLARITTISEKTVASDQERDPSGSDVGLPVGTTYFVLETEDFTPTPLRSKSRRTSSLAGAAAQGSPTLHRKVNLSTGKRTHSILNPSSLSTSPIIDRAEVRQAFSPTNQNGAASDYFSRTVTSPPPKASTSALSASQPPPTPSIEAATAAVSAITPGRTVILPTSGEPSSSPDPNASALSTSPSPPLHTRARTESSASPHGETRGVAIPFARPARPPSISSSGSVKHGSFVGPRSFNLAASHLAKAPPTTASSSEVFGDSMPHHPLSASMALPQSAAAAHLSKHSSSSDLGTLNRGGSGEHPHSSSPGRMSFMSIASGLGKRRSVSELERPESAAGGSGRE